MIKRVSLTVASAVVCYVVLSVAVTSLAAAAPGRTAVYRGRIGHATRLAVSHRGLAGLHAFHADAAAAPRSRLIPFRSPHGPQAGTAAAPKVSAGTAGTDSAAPASGGLIHAFNGLSDLDSFNLNGYPLTPPDQGLCVGPDPTLKGNGDAVWEPINSAARETTPTGRLLRPDVSLATLFQDPYAEGDVRCLYDPATKSFYFTEIGFPVATGPISDDNNTTADVVVMNAHGVAAYQFDTSLGQNCFGDQPKVGFDDTALVISTDEYCGPTETDYEGAIALAISKSQLVAEASTVKDAVLGPVSLAGDPVVGLDPAIDTGSATEYFLNSVPFLPSGANNPVGTTVGLWTLSNDSAVTSGHGSATLTGRSLPSEPYAFPVPAASTGDGSTTTLADGTVITSEAALNPDDSRMSGPVNVTRTPHGGVELWTALDAALTPSGDSATRDGAAWFEVDPTGGRITGQGYVAQRGASLLYPAMDAPDNGGPAAMVFTITSPTLNPSAAYTRLGSGTVAIVARGTGPHLSFSDAPPYNEPRWGDYSFAVPDPEGSGIWLATEYIPPPADQSPYDNWGTYVFEVPGR